MPIDGAEVRRIARLAHLDLEDGDVGALAGELESILAHVARLDELDVSAVEPTTAGTAAPLALREDVPAPRSESGAAETGGGFFRVPRILGD